MTQLQQQTAHSSSTRVDLELRARASMQAGRPHVPFRSDPRSATHNQQQLATILADDGLILAPLCNADSNRSSAHNT